MFKFSGQMFIQFRLLLSFNLIFKLIVTFGQPIIYTMSIRRFSLSFLLLLCKMAICQDLNFRKITADNGLSHNTIYTIIQDHRGFMWFGTRDGLNRYDGYAVKNYFIKNVKSDRSVNRITCLINSVDYLYIGTDNGLYLYDYSQDKIVSYPSPNSFSILSMAKVDSNVYLGTTSGLYVASRNGILRQTAINNKTVTSISALSNNRLLLSIENQLIIIDYKGKQLKTIAKPELGVAQASAFRVIYAQHDIDNEWLCTNDGLFQFNKQTEKLSRLKFTSKETQESNTVRSVTKDKSGKLYIGTENGLYLYDFSKRQSVNYQQSFDNDPKKLNDKAIYSAYTATDGSVWLGTYFGGVNYIPSISSGFKTIAPSEKDHQLNGKAISQMMEDKEHHIWIGTEDGGISIYNPNDQTFKNINKNSAPYRLDINNVHAIYDDQQGSIWAGTFLGGLHQFNLKTGKTTIYVNQIGKTGTISNDQVYAIYRDSRNQLWVGTENGLNIFDYKTGLFHLFKPEIFKDEFIYDMTEDINGDMWFCTRWHGIFRYQTQKNKIDHYWVSQKPASIPSNQIVSVYKDTKNQLWFGTLDGGVCMFNIHRQVFKIFNTENGLPNNNVYGILEDNQHSMWFSTNRGLSQYNLLSRKFTNYDNRYGLPSNQFNFKSFIKTSNGLLYFGTINGLCYFNPLSIKHQTQRLPIHFTSFKLFNKTVESGDSPLLPKQIDVTGSVNLKYWQNVFSIEYAAINFSNVKGSNYAYYLEGFEDKWNFTQDKNLVTYTNLSPGNYIFHLLAVDAAGIAVSKERVLKISISPPFYLTKTAIILYFLLLCFAVWLYTYIVNFLHLKKMEIQLERVEKEKTKELTQHRLNFFTFISHEFKTPLTLIIASIEKFVDDNQFNVAKNAELSIIKNNASRLFKMIQQLMEFRKIETDHVAIKYTRHDILKFIEDTTYAFKTIVRNKGLQLNFLSTQESYLCYFDADKVEKIIFNLLSNAIKNTNEGSINVDFKIDSDQDASVNVIICISDTGKGMSKKELENVFFTFYKGIDSDDGSGVGLALVNSLVKYLDGEIAIKSEVNTGTQVTVKFPVFKQLSSAQKEDSYENKQEEDEVNIAAIQNYSNDDGTKNNYTILIVEDNKELLIFLSKHLAKQYNVITASNGQAGFNKAMKQVPDLIISDIKMPKMDGIQLCKKIKTDTKSRHIPVILLSDNTKENVKLEGLDVGADSYLAKPFNLKELEFLISNTIRSRVQLREQLLDMSKFGLNKLPRNNKDQEFLANLSVVLERNFSSPQFTTEQMADELNVSRTLLHINLKKILNKSANQLLNEYRLKKAILMLENNLPINEVAYYSGYSDPNYFSRIFKKYYQVSPGTYRDNLPQTNVN